MADLHHALLLGLVHGPTELLPVSSSAHTALIPRLAGWPEAELDPDLAKALEVALHAGAGLAIALALREELLAHLRRPNGRELATLVLALTPPALAGYALESPIERRLGGPRSSALGLLLGGLVLGHADAHGPHARGAADATPRDGLLLGLAQALALIPGVSRNGATLTAARACGFTRAEAQTLSWRVGLPVLLGAASLKARRLAQRGVPPGFTAPLAVGAGAAFLSARACAPLIAPARRGRALLPFCAYRCGLAVLVAVTSRAGNAE